MCYLLTDCAGVEEPILTNMDLSAYVGLVVKISYCPDICWSVTETLECDGALETLEGTITSFADCDACNPPAPAVEISLKTRSVKPGYDTKACTPAYVEKIYCRFAEALYQETISKRYGIKVCCDIDLQKYQIKKELLDLQMIYDPEACVIETNNCCPPCNVSAYLTIGGYTTCPAPSNVVAVLGF